MESPNIKTLCAFTDNYIWMIVDTANKVWVIDPGDATPVISALEKNNFTIGGILITHHHHDHSGGIRELTRTRKNTPVYGSHKSPLKEITHPLKEGDEIICGATRLSILEIPGHTLDHIAFHNNEIVFSGDTLFSIGCGKVFEGTYSQMYHSLDKLKQLNEMIKIYCGHEYTLANLNFAHHIEPHNKNISDKIIQVKSMRQQGQPTLPSLLRDEKLLNPFLRCEDPEIINSVESHYKKKLTSPIEVFAHLREWKNNL